MVITQISYQKKDPSRVNLFVDGIFVCGLSINTLAKENLYESKQIDQDTIDRISREDLFERFFNRVIDYLARAPRSEFQIRKYLKELQYKKRDKWYERDISLDWEDLFNKIVIKLKEFKYIDDLAYAKMFVNSRISNKPRGKSILIGELISKGINQDMATEVCNELIEDEYNLLDKTFKKRFKEEKLDLSNKKMVDFLMRKGYSWDLIEKYSKDESTK